MAWVSEEKETDDAGCPSRSEQTVRLTRPSTARHDDGSSNTSYPSFDLTTAASHTIHHGSTGGAVQGQAIPGRHWRRGAPFLKPLAIIRDSANELQDTVTGMLLAGVGVRPPAIRETGPAEC